MTTPSASGTARPSATRRSWRPPPPRPQPPPREAVSTGKSRSLPVARSFLTAFGRGPARFAARSASWPPVRAAPARGDGALPHHQRALGRAVRARGRGWRIAALRGARGRGVPAMRIARAWLRACRLRPLRLRAPRGVRLAPGALPALAGRFPGAPFRTGHAPFVMHPALHDGSRREVAEPNRAGSARPSCDRRQTA